MVRNKFLVLLQELDFFIFHFGFGTMKWLIYVFFFSFNIRTWIFFIAIIGKIFFRNLLNALLISRLFFFIGRKILAYWFSSRVSFGNLNFAYNFFIDSSICETISNYRFCNVLLNCKLVDCEQKLLQVINKQCLTCSHK